MHTIKSFLVIVLGWQFLSTLVNNRFILPGVQDILIEYTSLFSDQRFLNAIYDSVIFLLQSWIMILSILFIILIFAILTKHFRFIFKSLCAAFQPTPTFAWLPIFMLVFGVNELTMMILIIFSTIWMTGLNLMSTLEESMHKWEKHCKNLRIGITQSILKVYLPSLKPVVSANLKTSWNLSWRILIAIEVVFGTIGNHWGIGTYMTDAKDVMEVNTMYAVFFFIMIIGIIVNEILEKFTGGKNEKNTKI